MTKIRPAVCCVVLCLVPCTAILAQANTKNSGSVPICSDKPVLNAPYSAKRIFIGVKKHRDGTVSRTRTIGSQVRDSQGRTYSAGERLWDYYVGKKKMVGHEMLYRIDDPVADTETRWDTSTKVAREIHWPKGAQSQSVAAEKWIAICMAFMTANTYGDNVQNVGKKTMDDVVVEGTRSSYTVPAGEDHNKRPLVVVHETWYSPVLEIVVLETNDDPRTGTTKDELTDIVRGKPDITEYRLPAGYSIRQIRMP
ncbi:MAG: hypothetical protein ACP5M4_12925 [Acidobacteriaceae bacterium]